MWLGLGDSNRGLSNTRGGYAASDCTQRTRSSQQKSTWGGMFYWYQSFTTCCIHLFQWRPSVPVRHSQVYLCWDFCIIFTLAHLIVYFGEASGRIMSNQYCSMASSLQLQCAVKISTQCDVKHYTWAQKNLEMRS